MVTRFFIFTILLATSVSAYGVWGLNDYMESSTGYYEGSGSGSSGEEPETIEENGSAISSDPIAVDMDCSLKEDGLYEIAGCSPQFLTCSGGIARIMDCPADLIYDSRIIACEYPLNVPGCSGASNAVPSTIEESTTEEPTTEATTTTEVIATTTELLTEEPVTSPRAANERVCTEDGFFSYGECSDSYTACSNGRSIPMMCPASLAFDEARQICNYPMAVPECVNNGHDQGSGIESSTSESSGEKPYEYGYGYEDPTTTIATADEPSSEATEQTVTYTEESVNTDVSSSVEPLNDEPSTTVSYPEEVSTEDSQVYESEKAADETTCVEGASEIQPCFENYRNCVNGQEAVFTCESGSFFSQSKGSCVTSSELPECESVTTVY